MKDAKNIYDESDVNLSKEAEEKKNETDIDENAKTIESENNEAFDKYDLNEVEAKKEEHSLQEQELFELDIEIEKLEVQLDQLEMSFKDEDDAFEHADEYEKLKNQIKELSKKRKELLKNKNKTDSNDKDNHTSLWIPFYGIVMAIVCMPGISYTLWLEFAQWLIDVFGDSLDSALNITWLYYTLVSALVYALPLILILLSWLLYLNLVKGKKNKKMFVIFWIIQALETIAMMIYVGIVLFGD